MKKLLMVVMTILLSFAAQKVLANGSGDVGSPECLIVQNDAQDSVISGGPYRNHGQMVRTAANVVGAAVDSGEVTEECASCIVSQFAHKSIPLDEQEPCGQGTEVECPCFPESILDTEARVLANVFCPEGILLGYMWAKIVGEGTLEGDAFEASVFPEPFPPPLPAFTLNCVFIDEEAGIGFTRGLSEDEYNKCYDVLINSDMWDLNCSDGGGG